MNHEFVTTQPLGIVNAAKYLGISRSTLYRLIADGQIKSFRIARRAFISTVELRRYVASRQAETMDQDAPGPILLRLNDGTLVDSFDDIDQARKTLEAFGADAYLQYKDLAAVPPARIPSISAPPISGISYPRRSES